MEHTHTSARADMTRHLMHVLDPWAYGCVAIDGSVPPSAALPGPAGDALRLAHRRIGNDA